MRFDEPLYFLFLLLLPLCFFFSRKKWRAAFRYPVGHYLRSRVHVPHMVLGYFPQIIRVSILACIILALARPYYSRGVDKRSSEGLDIVLAIDTSGSMRALDFEIDGARQDRLVVVKKVIEKFVAARVDDRLGMVVFGSEAFTQAPLTLDHEILLRLLERVEIGMAGDGTAIGDALVTSTKRLQDIEAKSRVVILLTDGENNSGVVDPRLAADTAAALGIRVYTIAVGKDGKVPFPVEGVFGTRLVYRDSDLDEKVLMDIAEKTQGRFFRATDTETLEKVYQTIDELEKTRVEVDDFSRREEAYMSFVWPAFLLLIFEILFSTTRFWRLP